MRRQRPVNAKETTSTRRYHQRQRPVIAPSTRQHPAPSPPTPPLRSRAARGTARAARIQPPLRWRSACGRTLTACPFRMNVDLAGRVGGRVANQVFNPCLNSVDERARAIASSSSLLSSIDILTSAPAPCSALAAHRDQQSQSLLADGAIRIVLNQLFAIARLIDRHWECHGKIAGEMPGWRSLQDWRFGPRNSGKTPGGSKLVAVRIFDVLNPYSAALSELFWAVYLRRAILLLFCAGERDSSVRFSGVPVSHGAAARQTRPASLAWRWRAICKMRADDD